MIIIEIPVKYEALHFDYIDDSHSESIYVGYNGGLYYKEISIDNFKKDSNIIVFVNNYLKENHLLKEDYDIYYQKEKEWYSKLYFYSKKK